MSIQIVPYTSRAVSGAIEVWNQVVEEGVAFPQMEALTETTGDLFFREQSFTGLACDVESGEVAGLYILHPNNVGRCGHICNASYAVRADRRGEHIGEQLVRHCLAEARTLGFRILQFNAVVSSNRAALALYQKLGFTRLGVIPDGFLLRDGSYVDIIPHYRTL